MNNLYVMMGYPGSGKSFWSREEYLKKSIGFDICADSSLVLSSDDLREELYGFRDQTHNKEVFEELYRRAIEHSSVGDVLIDSTALTRKDRLRIVSQLKKHFNSLVLLFVLCPIDEIPKMNNIRKTHSDYYGEPIPDDILKSILGRFQLPSYDEGWDDIFLINNSDNNYEYNIFNYLGIYDIPHNNLHHSETVKEHINYVMERCARDSDNRLILTKLAYYHDLGKFYTQTYNEEKGYCQTLGHASVSAYIFLYDYLMKYLMVSYPEEGTEVYDLMCLHIDEDTYIYDDYEHSNFFNIIRFEDIFSREFFLMFYLIYYHDLPYSCPDYDSLLKSVSKPSKEILKTLEYYDVDIDYFIELLMSFNYYDRLRKDEDGQSS